MLNGSPPNLFHQRPPMIRFPAKNLGCPKKHEVYDITERYPVKTLGLQRNKGVSNENRYPILLRWEWVSDITPMRMGIQYYSDENGYPILLQMRLGIQYYSDENGYPILLRWEWVSDVTLMTTMNFFSAAIRSQLIDI